MGVYRELTVIGLESDCHVLPCISRENQYDIYTKQMPRSCNQGSAFWRRVEVPRGQITYPCCDRPILIAKYSAHSQIPDDNGSSKCDGSVSEGSSHQWTISGVKDCQNEKERSKDHVKEVYFIRSCFQHTGYRNEEPS